MLIRASYVSLKDIKMGFFRTSIALISLAVLTTFAPAASFSADLAERAKAAAVAHYAQQPKELNELRADTSVDGLLKLARYLTIGLQVTPNNPLRVPQKKEAVDLFRQALDKAETQQQRDEVVKEITDILGRSNYVADKQEAAAIAAKYKVAITSPVDGQKVNPIDPTVAQEKLLIDELKNQSNQGSISATFDLYVLLTKKGSPEAESYGKQALYMATVGGIDSTATAVDAAARFLSATPSAFNRKAALTLLKAAAVKGSDSAVNLAVDTFESATDPDIGKALREIIESGVTNGSGRAAELVAFDLTDENKFGFTKDESLWAIQQLQEVGIPAANYPSAKLYFDGVYVPQDLTKAETYLAKMIELDGTTAAYRELIGTRILQLKLPVELQIKYTLPLFTTLMNEGKAGSTNRVANLIISGSKAGLFNQTNPAPISGPDLLAMLQKSAATGDEFSKVVIADMLREGRLVPEDRPQSITLYKDVLATTTDDTLVPKVEERLAKALRHNGTIAGENEEYLALLKSLSGKKNLWAMREYGAFLLTGTAVLNADPAAGKAMLLEVVQSGNLTAITPLLAYSRSVSDKDLQNQLVKYLEVRYKKENRPDIGTQLASLYHDIGKLDLAEKLLGSDNLANEPHAMFLRAQIGRDTGKWDLARLRSQVLRVMKIGAPTDEDMLKYARFLLRLSVTKNTPDDDYPLQVINDLAKRGNADAILVAVDYYNDSVRPGDDRFNQLLAWSGDAASHGTGDALTKMTAKWLGPKTDNAINAQIVKVIETNIAAVPGSGILRMALSTAYAEGYGVAKDPVKANRYRDQASALGNLLAIYQISGDYYYGIGRDFRPADALKLYETIAGLGSNRGRLALARLFSSSADGVIDEPLAFSQFLKAAKNGSVTAMNEVGRAYFGGVGVAPDDKKALAWVQKAADLGDVGAMTQLYFYYAVHNPSHDNKEAEFWLDKMIDIGVPSMMVRKAVLLNVKDPVGNKQAVTDLLDRAISLGNSFARRYKNTLSKEAQQAVK